MTAMNVWCGPTSAHLLTDTAVYGTTGLVEQFLPKTLTISHPTFHAAIATTGHLFPRTLESALASQRFSSLSDLWRVLPDALAAVERQVAERQGYATLGMVIASWTPGEGPKARCLANAGGSVFPDPYPAYRVCQIDYFLTGNGHHPALATSGTASADINAVELARDIIATQRAEKFEQGYYAIGGTATLTTVGATGITMTEVAAWPDRLGEPIDPQSSQCLTA